MPRANTAPLPYALGKTRVALEVQLFHILFGVFGVWQVVNLSVPASGHRVEACWLPTGPADGEALQELPGAGGLQHAADGA